MPITVTCGECGKGLKVRDELIGKNVKCPGCGSTMKALAVVSASGVSTWAGKKAKQTAAEKAKKETPRVHLSPMAIVLISVTVIGLFVSLFWAFGPGAVRAEIVKNDAQWQSDITDVVNKLLQAHLSIKGSYNPWRSHAIPQSVNLTMLYSPLYMTVPDRVGFIGTSTEGAYSGFFHPKTGEVEVEAELGGQGLSTGVLMKRGKEKIEATGRVKDGKVVVEMNGKPIEIYFPPKTDDDK